MPSPFPGMDPYIESQRWMDFHHGFTTETQVALVPYLRPRYIVCIEERVYLERTPEDPPRRYRPDLAVLADETYGGLPRGASVAVISRPVYVPLAMPERVEELYLEVRLRDSDELVTIIEVLSPANKRAGSDGQKEYLSKREAVIRSKVSLLEIDLLRGGESPPMAKPMPRADHYVVLSRAGRRPWAEVWPISLRAALPTVPVPLAGEDPDVPLDLQAVFTSVYDRAGYDYSIDYRRDPLPPLSEEDRAWVETLQPGRPTAPPQ